MENLSHNPLHSLLEEKMFLKHQVIELKVIVLVDVYVFFCL